MIGIYHIENPNGSVYIGQSWNVLNRQKQYSKLYCKKQIRLYNSIRKHGWVNHIFSVIIEFKENISQELLDFYEQFFIDFYRNDNVELMNIREAGSKGKHSEETKKKLSNTRLIRKSGVGFKMNEKTREAIKEANTGRKRTQQTKSILSEKLTGNNNGIYNKGKTRSLETRRNISNTLKSKTDNKGECHGCVKITNESVLEIRSKYIPRKYSSRKLATEYNLSKTNILDIVKRKIWKHI